MATKTKKKKEEVFENLFRFKFAFIDCKSYKEVQETLAGVSGYFERAEQLGAVIEHNGDDYFFLRGTNPLLKKELGFEVPDYDEEEVS